MATYSPSREYSSRDSKSSGLFYVIVALVAMALAIPAAIATFA